MKNRNKIIGISLFFIGLNYSLGSFHLYQVTFESLAWAGETGIELPPLTTDEDKIKFLIWIKNKVPNLFSDAAQYDIDLMGILDDQEKLVDLLKKKHPEEYEKEFQKRRYVELTITPPPGGIEVNQVKLKAGVIDEWKNSLRSRLAEWAKGKDFNGQSSLSDQLKEDLLKSFTSEAPQGDKNLGKEDAHVLAELTSTDEFKSKYPKGTNPWTKNATFFEKLEVIHGKMSGENPELKVDSQLKKKLEDLRARLQSRAKVNSKDLAELYLALTHAERAGQKSHNLESAQTSLTQLSEDDLHYFSDEDDVLKPEAAKLTQDPKKQDHLVRGLNSNLKKFTTQTEGNLIQATEPVHLREVTPREAIFRGCTGGDCSSQYSFPYPNDPHERVFYISDKKGDLKGYVSSTVVNSDGKKSLYVITISGKRVNAGDAELILRGLNQAKKGLGVDEILLPNEKNLAGLINFPEIRAIYQKHVKSQQEVPIVYQSKNIRQDIENFQSKNNSVDYDYMNNNKTGVILKEYPKKSEKLKAEFKFISLPEKPFQGLQLTREAAIEFALDMNHSKRKELVKRIMPFTKLSEQELNNGLKTLENEELLKIEDYKKIFKNFPNHGDLT